MITRRQIEEWIDPSQVELPKVEFKIQPPESDPQVRHWVNTVAALANAGGGCIIVGVGDKPKDGGARPHKMVSRADPGQSKQIDKFLDTVNGNIEPRTITSCYDIKMTDDWTVVVVEVPHPQDFLLRLSYDKPQTRLPKPAVEVMTPEDIWRFHKQQLAPEAVRLIQSMEQNVVMFLSELAFELTDKELQMLDWEIALTIAARHALAENDQKLSPLLEKYHLLRFTEAPREVGFAYASACSFYAALYLQQRNQANVIQFVLEDKWRGVILSLAGISRYQVLQGILKTLLDNAKTGFALECYLNRDRSTEIDESTRGSLRKAVEQLLKPPSTHHDRAIVYAMIAERILRDRNTDFRLECLRLLEDTQMPPSMLKSLIGYLDQGDPNNTETLRSQVAAVIGSGKIEQKIPPDILEQCVQSMLPPEDYPPARDNKAIAIAHLLRYKEADISEGAKGIIAGTLLEMLQYYHANELEPSRAVDSAMHLLQEAINGTSSPPQSGVEHRCFIRKIMLRRGTAKQLQ